MMIILFSLLMAMTNPLDEFKWKNRVVLVFSTDAAKVREQLDMLEADKVGLKNRDLKIFTITDKETSNAGWSASEISSLQKSYNPESSPFKLVLIGKDGTEKLKSSGIVKREVLFSVIDQMPMRRVEMKNDIREKGN